MNLHSMKRKELQALCKKHNIPANLTNLEMVNKLTSLLQEEDKPITKGKSCLKFVGQIGSVNDYDENRKVKKVKFSPENEMIEFVDLDPDPREARRVARRRSMGRALTEKGKDLVVENDEISESITGNATRNTRSRAQKFVGEVVRTGPIEKKRARRGARADSLEAEEVDRNANLAFESAAVGETGVATRRSLRNREVVSENDNIGDHPVRNRRSQAQKAVGNAVRSVTMLPIEKKRARRGVSADSLEVKVVDRNSTELSGNLVSETSAVEETGVPVRRSLRNRDVVSENQKEGETVGHRKNTTRITNKNAKGNEEVSESKGLAADGEITLPEKPLTRSNRNVKKVGDREPLNGELGQNEMVRGGRITRFRTQRALEETEVRVQGETEIVVQVEGLPMHLGRNGNERKSVMHRKDKVLPEGPVAENENRKLLRRPGSEGGSTVEIRKENEKDSLTSGPLRRSRRNTSSEPIVEQLEEPSMHPGQNGKRKKKVVLEGPVAENETTKLTRSSCSEGSFTVEIPENEKDSLPSSPLRRSRRNTPREPFVEPARRTRQNGTIHESMAVSDALDRITNAIVEKKPRKRRRDPIREEETVATELATLIEETPRRSKRNAVKSNLVVTGVAISKGIEQKKVKGRSGTPILEVEAPPLCENSLASQKQSKKFTETESYSKKVVCPGTSDREKTPIVEVEAPPIIESSLAIEEPPLILAKLPIHLVLECAIDPVSSSHKQSLKDIDDRKSSRKMDCPGISDIEKARDSIKQNSFGTPASKSANMQSHYSHKEEESSVSKAEVVTEKVNISFGVDEGGPASQSLECSGKFDISTFKTLPIVNAALSEQEVQESASSSVLSSSSKVLINSDKKKGLARKSNLKQHGSNEVCARSPHLEGIRDPSVVKQEENEASISMKLPSDSPEQEMDDSGIEFVGVAEKEIADEVVGSENPLQSDVGKDNKYDLASQPQMISTDPNCSTFVDLESASENVTEISKLDLSDRGRVTPNMVGDNVEDGLLEMMSVSSVIPDEKVTELQLTSDCFSSGMPSCKLIDAPEYQACCTGNEVTNSTGDVLSIDNDARKQGDDMYSQERTEEFSTDMENKPEEASNFRKAMQSVDNEISYEQDGQLAKDIENKGLEMNCIHASEEIREESTLVISEGRDTDTKEDTFSSIATPKYLGNDGIMSPYHGAPLKDDGSGEGDGLKLLFATPANDRNPNEEASGLETGIVDVMMPKGLPQEVGGTMESDLENSASKSNAPIFEEEFIDGLSKKADVYDCIPLKDDASEEGDGLKTLFATPAHDRNSDEETSSHKIGTVDVIMLKGLPQEVVETMESVHKKSAASKSNGPPISDEDIGECSNEKAGVFDRTPLKDDGSQEGNGLETLFATPANVRSYNEAASSHETGTVDATQPKGLPREVLGAMESEHKRSEASKSNAPPISHEEFIDQGSNEKADVYDRTLVKDDETEEGGLKTLFATPANDTNFKEASSHETGTVDVPHVLPREVAMESEHETSAASKSNAIPISEEKIIDKGSNEKADIYDCTPLKDDGTEEGDVLKTLFATPVNDRNFTEEAFSHEASSLPQEVVGKMENEQEKSAASKSNALPIFDEEFIDEGFSEKTDVYDRTPLKDDRSEGDGLKTLFTTPATARNFTEEASSHEIGTVVMMPRDLPLEVVGIMESDREKSAASKSSALPISDEEYIDGGSNEKADVESPHYFSEHQGSGISNKEMLSIKRNLSADDEKIDKDDFIDVPSKYTTEAEAMFVAKSMEGDFDVHSDDLGDEEEKAEFAPEVTSSEPFECEDGLTQVIGHSGAGLADTISTESEAFEEKLTADLSKSSSKCFEGTIVPKVVGNEGIISSFSPLGLGKVAVDHGDEFAKWNMNSPDASDEVSEKCIEEELSLADGEADLDYNEGKGVSMVVKNRKVPEPEGVECGELETFNDVVDSALDKTTPASVKHTDSKGDVDLVEYSNVNEEAMPQADELKSGDCAGYMMEMVQELDKGEDGEESQELAEDEVTGDMLQVDEGKRGDLDSQIDVSTMEGSLNVKERNCDAVKKTDVHSGCFEFNLEQQKVSNSSSFSTNASNSDREKYGLNEGYITRMSMAEGKKTSEVFSEQLNDAHGVTVSSIASIFFDGDKDAKDGSHIEDEARSFPEVTKERPANNNEDAVADDDFLGGFGCLPPNKLLCVSSSKSIAEETKEAISSLHNRVDMVLCAGDSNESAEYNTIDPSVSEPAGNADSDGMPSSNHGTTDHSASGFNVESSMFSSWEMNLMLDDADFFAVEKLYGCNLENTYICDGSENAEVEENATTMLAEEKPSNSEYHMEEKFEESNASPIASSEPICEDEESKEFKDAVVATEEYNHSKFSEKEESGTSIRDINSTDIANINGCEHAPLVEPRDEGDSGSTDLENLDNTDVVDINPTYILEDEKCGERGEEIETSEDVLKLESRTVDQRHSFTDSAVDGGIPPEDVQFWQSKSESAQRKHSVAEMEDNTLSAKQLTSVAKKGKDSRASFIQGMPKKLIAMLDMKENAPSIKREHMGNATMGKSVTKRRALEDLRRT